MSSVVQNSNHIRTLSGLEIDAVGGAGELNGAVIGATLGLAVGHSTGMALGGDPVVQGQLALLSGAMGASIGAGSASTK